MDTSPADYAIFCFGNSARGDDALGEHMHTFLQQHFNHHPALANRVRLIGDFQLEPEHLFDLKDARCGIFVDAHQDIDTGVQWYAVKAGTTLCISSHHLPVESLLYLYEETFGEDAPPCFMLTMGGERFELEENLSARAQQHLAQAKTLLLEKLV